MNSPLLLLCSGGMELCWLYAWATFLTTSVLGRPFPLPEAIGSFALAAALTSLSRGRGWRVVTVFGFQLLGFVPALLRMGRVFNSWSDSYSSRVSPELFNATMGSSEWILAMLVLLWGFLFWGTGVGLVKRPSDYGTLCQRFDLGLAAFFLVILARLALSATSRGAQIGLAPWLVFAFFPLGLTAISLARGRAAASADPSSGSGTGTAVSATAAVVLLGGGATLLVLPRLTGVAAAGYDVLKAAGRPLLAALWALLAFLSGDDVAGRSATTVRKKLEHTAGQAVTPAWLQFLGEAIAWAGRVVLGLAVLAALAAIVWFTVRGLLSRTAADPDRPAPLSLRLAPLWARARRFLTSLQQSIARALDRDPTGRVLYGALLGWGRRSGLRRGRAETPREYAARLECRFPAVRHEIALIVDAFQREVYGEIPLGRARRGAGRSAVRRLKHPSLWGARLRARLLRPDP